MNIGPRLALGARGQDVQRAQTIFAMIKTLGFEQIVHHAHERGFSQGEFGIEPDAQGEFDPAQGLNE